MNYSLGNMLGGAGALNADKLSLDLQFAADKTLTARKGPTPTFTRASGATFVNNLGEIKYARENLILQSQNFSSASWQKLNGATVGSAVSDPFGGTSAYTIDFSSTSLSRVEQTSPSGIQVGNVVTISVYLRADSNTTISTRFATEPLSIFNVTTTWQRFTYTATVSTGVFPQITNNSASNKTIYAYGFQVERHEFARAYIPTTTAAVYQPRFDHDPVTFASKGLLIEESRTNLLFRSDDFGASEWNAGSARNLTVASDNTTSPSGATDADRLTVGATTTVYQVIQNLPASGNLTSGTAYTVSGFFKANQVTRISIWAGNTVTIPFDAMFDLTGSGSVVANAFGTASIQAYSNGWYRCVITGTAGATSGTTLRISPVSGTSRTYAGNSTDSFYAWGVQLEAGSFPTSYIPTTTASVVRSGDVCSITGSAFTGFYNQREGTVLTDSIPAAVAGTVTIFSLSNGTANERWVNRFAQNEQVVVTSAGTESGLDAINPVAGQRYKVVTTGKVNDFAMSINGLAAVTDTSQLMPVVDRAGIGNLTAVASSGAMTIASIRYYKKRLSNAKIQALSTV